MRKAAFVGIALLAALALSVGAFAYPMVVGIHPLTTPHPSAPAIGTHPQNGDNSTGNGTGDHENETSDHENETFDHENETSDNETGDHGNETGGNGNETGDNGNETGDQQGNETGDQQGNEPPEANDTENDSGNNSGMDAAVQTLALTPSVVTSWMVSAHSGTGLLTLVQEFASVEWSLATSAWGHLFG